MGVFRAEVPEGAIPHCCRRGTRKNIQCGDGAAALGESPEGHAEQLWPPQKKSCNDHQGSHISPEGRAEPGAPWSLPQALEIHLTACWGHPSGWCGGTWEPGWEAPSLEALTHSLRSDTGLWRGSHAGRTYLSHLRDFPRACHSVNKIPTRETSSGQDGKLLTTRLCN